MCLAAVRLRKGCFFSPSIPYTKRWQPVTLYPSLYPTLPCPGPVLSQLSRAVICTTFRMYTSVPSSHKALYWPMSVPCWSLYATTHCSPMLNCLININVISKFRAARKQRRLKNRKSASAHRSVARSRKIGATQGHRVGCCFPRFMRFSRKIRDQNTI